MTINLRKFQKFSTTVKCTIDKKNISILIDKIEGYIPFYELDDDEEEWIHLKYLNRYKYVIIYFIAVDCLILYFVLLPF